jgi:hypothetical protein
MESKCPTLQQISGKIEDKLHHNSIERNSWQLHYKTNANLNIYFELQQHEYNFLKV